MQAFEIVLRTERAGAIFHLADAKSQFPASSLPINETTRHAEAVVHLTTLETSSDVRDPESASRRVDNPDADQFSQMPA